MFNTSDNILLLLLNSYLFFNSDLNGGLSIRFNINSELASFYGAKLAHSFVVISRRRSLLMLHLSGVYVMLLPSLLCRHFFAGD